MQEDNNIDQTNKGRQTISIRGMYQDWFLDYASYVILERAIPHIDDGLKPVQRRILHSMHELDDGRYTKVANIVGNTMKYHPHGDASIGDAITGLGQKGLMIDTQGNWGNILTGDPAAAPRYIEARLSKFALETSFNYRLASFHPSYDGRNQEPDTLPIKFPLLLAQGAKGIAVGLACEILPHNFVELLDASIAILKDEPFTLYPDFPTGGLMDVSQYNDGKRGGKLFVRARIEREDAKTLVITELPYSATADSIIDSIAKACDSGRLRISKIENTTAQNAEIRLHLPKDVSIDQTIDALYAFTDCQKSISPNSCVIDNQKPCFMSISDILRRNTQRTESLLKKELELDLSDLKEKWQWINLEKIFIENEIYEQIKPCTTDESINKTIIKGLEPFVKDLMRAVTQEDIQKLRKIPIDRISKFNSDKADNDIKAIEVDMDEVKNNLLHLTDYTIKWFKHLKDKYGKDKQRKTTIRSFHHIEVTQAAAQTEKLYCNYKEGFVGYKLKGDNVEYVSDCSALDDIIVVRSDGTYVVKKISEKDFVGNNVIYVAVFKRGDERTIYNIMYNNGPYGKCFAKRCAITGIIRDKQYDFTQGVKGSTLLYFSANPNGEAEKVQVYLKARPKMKRLSFVYDFAELLIKNRSAHGNIVDNNPVRRVSKKTGGISTLGAQKIWLDKSIWQLNTLERGDLLGEFKAGDKLLVITQKGTYRITDPDLNLHFDEDTIVVEKYDPQKPITIIYWDNESSAYYIKRFVAEKLSNDRIAFLDEEKNTLKYCITDYLPVISVDNEEKQVTDIVDVMKYKAKGKKISKVEKAKIKILEPLPYQPPVVETTQEENDEIDSDFDSDKGVQGSLF